MESLIALVAAVVLVVVLAAVLVVVVITHVPALHSVHMRICHWLADMDERLSESEKQRRHWSLPWGFTYTRCDTSTADKMGLCVLCSKRPQMHHSVIRMVGMMDLCYECRTYYDHEAFIEWCKYIVAEMDYWKYEDDYERHLRECRVLGKTPMPYDEYRYDEYMCLKYSSELKASEEQAKEEQDEILARFYQNIEDGWDL